MYDTFNWLPTLLSTFIVATIALHLALVWPRLRLKARQWKYVDYLWLGVALTALVGVNSELRRDVASHHLDAAERFAAQRLDFFRDLYLDPETSYVCRKSVRSELSPPDFDEVAAEFGRACEWLRGLQSEFEATDWNDLPVVEFSEFSGFAATEPTLTGYIDNFSVVFGYYTDAARNVERIRVDLQETDAERRFKFWSPVLLAMALAFRLTKTTGEIRAGGSVI